MTDTKTPTDVPEGPSGPDRLPGEGPKPRAAFLAYLDLGPGRSLDAVRRGNPGGIPERDRRHVERWSTRFRWVERADAYDNRQEAIRQGAIDREAADSAALWERRRQSALEMAFEDAAGLRARARDFLALPIFTEETRPDGTVVRRPSGKWNYSMVAQMLKLAVEIEHAVLLAATGSVPEMTEAELRAVAGVGVPPSPRGPIPHPQPND